MPERGVRIERFREAPWFPPSGWYWRVADGSSGVARTKAKAKDRVARELARVGTADVEIGGHS